MTDEDYDYFGEDVCEECGSPDCGYCDECGYIECDCRCDELEDDD